MLTFCKIVGLIDAYRQFYKQSSDVASAYEFLKERFSHGESVIFLAFEGDQALGFTQLYPSFSSVSMARVFILNDLFVAQATYDAMGWQLALIHNAVIADLDENNFSVSNQQLQGDAVGQIDRHRMQML